MELKIYSAFDKAGTPADAAHAPVDSSSKEIDKRYAQLLAAPTLAAVFSEH